MADKLCVYWQGRKSMGGGVVRKYGVFKRCYKNLDQALHATRTIAKRRVGGAALLQEKSTGLSLTLITCFRSRCKATHFGRKLGL